jgi:hypothetical protein
MTTGELATMPSIEIDGNLVLVDVRIYPNNIRQVDNPKVAVDDEKAKILINEYWSENLTKVKLALIEKWQIELNSGSVRESEVVN